MTTKHQAFPRKATDTEPTLFFPGYKNITRSLTQNLQNIRFLVVSRRDYLKLFDISDFYYRSLWVNSTTPYYSYFLQVPLGIEMWNLGILSTTKSQPRELVAQILPEFHWISGSKQKNHSMNDSRTTFFPQGSNISFYLLALLKIIFLFPFGGIC